MILLALAGPRHWKGSENFMEDIPEHEECSAPRRFRVHGRNQPQTFPLGVLIRSPHLISCRLKTTTLTGLISLLSKGLSRVFSNNTVKSIISGLDPAGIQRGEERTPKPPHTHSQLPGEVGSQSMAAWMGGEFEGDGYMYV